ncbi:MAG: amino acid adenylation domain-containing protein [Calditrichia bacterium]
MSKLSKKHFTYLNTLNKTNTSIEHTTFAQDQIAEFAVKFPNRIAVESLNESLSYKQLMSRADRVAAVLRSNDVSAGDYVGIWMERSPQMVVAILAILRVGAAYVPLDPVYPEKRLHFILEDTASKIVLTESRFKQQLEKKSLIIICEDDLPEEKHLSTSLPKNYNSANPVYIIHTSGSTGTPKGVPVSQRNLQHSTAARAEYYDGQVEKFLLLSSFSFDSSVAGIFWTLTQGGTLCLPKSGVEQDAHRIAEHVKYFKPTHMLALPSLYALILEQTQPAQLNSLKHVIVAGEACPPALCHLHAQKLPETRLYNEYGPTEASVWSTVFEISKGFDGDIVPIGKPVANTRVFILNEKLEPVAQGEAGELYIGGEGVTGGYLNRDELTIERFIKVPAPLADYLQEHQRNAMLYRTGDKVLCNFDGFLEFHGRVDQQIKLRGYRIEPGEIEACLQSVNLVTEAVVLLREDRPGIKRLVGYVLAGGKKPEAVELRAHLRKSLPDHMVPTSFMMLDEFPRIPNGKVDRNAFSAPDRGRPPLEQAYVAPQNELEKQLHKLWCDTLDLEEIGVNDPFFDLGGDSLLAARFVGNLQQLLDEPIFVVTLFSAPTISTYASFLLRDYKKSVARWLGISDYDSSTDPKKHTLQDDDLKRFQSIIPTLSLEASASEDSKKNPRAMFILAPPRSGTTLLRVMLAGHPQLFAANELQLLGFQTMAERSKAYSGKFSLWLDGLIRTVMALQNCTADEARSIIAAYEQQGFTTQQMFGQLQEWIGEAILVDKSPQYALDVNALHKAEKDFAEPLYIQLVRHPYAMVSSFRKRRMEQVVYLDEHSFNARETGELVWLESHRVVGNFLKDIPSNRKVVLRYEDLVTRPKEVLRGLCDAFFLPFDEAVLNPYHNLDNKMIDGVYSDSTPMGDPKFMEQRGINPALADSWKGVEKDNFLSDMTWKLAESHGYERPKTSIPVSKSISSSTGDIAIVGMAGRLPGADSIDAFWDNLKQGIEAIQPLSDEALLSSGVDIETLKNPLYVKAGASAADIAGFDAGFFGFHKREAEMMDPQHRMFLEGAWSALEHAGYDPERYEGDIGVFGGVARNSYLTANMLTHQQYREGVGEYISTLGSEKDFPATRVAHKLNLRGPAMSVQTACSTTGVAIHLASQSLRYGDCNMAIVGGCRVQVPNDVGYFHLEGGPLSPDGHLRAFDAAAKGMVKASGGAFLVLKPLADAQRDGDTIHAVLKASAINNDGSDKAGFTAPGVAGQARVVQQAIERAGVSPETIGYLEAHGTGTVLGDPIEVAALTKAWRKHTDKKEFCALGSVKTNIGHLDAGACAASVIKTVLALQHKKIPANLHFNSPNPQLDLPNSPFFVNNSLIDWPAAEHPRRAGVSSLGLGGTNAHLILEEAPEIEAVPSERKSFLLVVSARTEVALMAARVNLANHLERHPEINLADVSHTLLNGRKLFDERAAFAVESHEHAAHLLRNAAPHQMIRLTQPRIERRVAFLFAGGGAQYLRMGQDLYQEEPTFREAVDLCAEILRPLIDRDIREVLFPSVTDKDDDASKGMETPSLALPALFTIQFACAKLWMSWGVAPTAMIGHSMGEYTAACLAGVFSLTDALALITLRGQLFETLAAGSMLSVPLTENELTTHLGNDLSFAAINRSDSCVVSGPTPQIKALQQKLESNDIECTLLRISVAAHSAMVEPILAPFRKFLEGVTFNAPKLRFVSNLSGTWITAEEAKNPDYWVKHLRQTVRFADGLSCLLQDEQCVLLEVGPGRTLSSFARQHPAKKDTHIIGSTLRHPREQVPDLPFLLNNVGLLWAANAALNWQEFLGAGRRRVPLPTYPFERKRYWIEPLINAASISDDSSSGIETISVTEDQIVTNQPNIPPRSERIGDELQRIIHELSGVDMKAIARDTSFLELGFDSLFLTQANSAFQKLFKVKISFRQLFEEAPTINMLAAFIDQKMPADAFPAPTPEPVAAPSAPAAPMAQPTAISDAPTAQIAITAPAGSVQNIVQQQLQLMQQQLQLLGGAPIEAVASVAPTQGNTLAQEASGAGKSATTTTPSAPPAEAKKGDGAAHGPWKPVQRKRASEYTDRQINALEKLIIDYTTKTRGSKELTESQRPRLADPRAISGFRHVWKEMIYQIAGVRSKGCRVWDIDDNEYIDLNMGFGINFFGHSPDFVIKAIEEQLAKGIELGVLTPLAKDVAELICELTGMERVNFVNTGSEAVSAAVRAARTASGRDRIAVFRKDYHGISDELLVRPVDLGGKRISKPVSPGIPDFLVENVIILDYDDSCIDVIREHADDLAGVIFEPVPAHDPAFQPREIIHKVREVTRELDIAMIFDELITGFRLHPRGAQGFYDVDVDICAYGKIVCGGLPMAAVAGSAKYMNAFDGGLWQFGDDSYPEGGVTFFGGTFVRHPLCLSSSRAVLQKMADNGTKLHDDLNAKTADFSKKVNAIFKRLEVPMEMVTCASMILIRFIEDGPFNPLFWFFLRLNGVLFRDRSGFLCVDHSEEDLKEVLNAIEKSVLDMKASGFVPGQDLGEDEAAAIAHLNGNSDSMSLTPSQMEIWLASQLGEKASCAFNLSSRISLQGDFDISLLQKALDDLCGRHEALRTTFQADGERQIVAQAIKLKLPFTDLSELDRSTSEEVLREMCEEDARTAFDLENGPLVRFQVIRSRPNQHEIIVTAHHIICDGWSFGIVLKDLAALYSAHEMDGYPSLEAPLQFRDFVAIRDENLEIVGTASSDFWHARYAEDIPVLELPTDRPRPRTKSYVGGYKRKTLSSELFSKIQKLATEKRSTTFGVLMAAYGVLLSRLSGQEDVVVGLAAAGQTAIGKKEVVGHCVTLLPMRLQVPWKNSFSSYFDQVKSELMEAYDHQDYTFGDLLSSLGVDRDPSRLPLVSTMITYETGSEKLHFGDLKTAICPNPKGYCNFDLELYLMEDKGELTLRFEYNSDLFDSNTIDRWLSHYNTILEAACSNVDEEIGQLPLIATSELHRMLYGWNDTLMTYPAERGLHEIFEEQVDMLGATTKAAVFTDGSGKSTSLTYSELDERSNRLANYLVKNGMRAGDFVGVYLNRSPKMLISLLGILKAGAAYVPLDPSFPKDRVSFMIEDSGMTFILTTSDLAEDIQQSAVTVVQVDQDAQKISRAAKRRKKLPIDPERLAYLIYTSGSTGKPKGVQIAHHSVVNFLMTMATERPGMTRDDVLLALTTISFDISVLELFLPLSTGATVVVAPSDTQQNATKISKLLEEHNCTMMQATPTNWAMLFEAGWKGKKGLKALSGGEALTPELVGKLLESCGEVWNMYGPTETTIWSSVSKIESALEAITIGSPIGNNYLYVLDKNRNPQPVGVPGELYIGGRGLAVGYLNRKDLTNDRFVDVQLPGEMKLQRLYRTGDLVRWTVNGELEFAGRIDHQVKLRGYRIELGEIESLLNEIPEVDRAVVAVKEWGPGDRRLAAYVLKTAANGFQLDRAKDHLRSRLPEYMIPSSIVSVDTFPLTPNGKIDRNALPLPGFQTESHSKGYTEPRSETETALQQIWQEVLGFDKIGITDDFFDIGGHSLLATRVIMKVNKQFNTELLFSALFEYVTIGQLAEVIDQIVNEQQLTIPQYDNLVEGSL